jgi:hypothetical protein
MEEVLMLILAIAVFLLIVFIIIPISVFVLIGIAVVGIISGAGVALYNFGVLLIEAHKTLS